MSAGAEDDRSSRRDAYHARLRAAGLEPLWTFYADWFTDEPRVRSEPQVWRYAELRNLLLESAAVIDHSEAERRVAALENSGLSGRKLATESLYAGLQLIMPGERAPSHRHSPIALRFVIEGSGAWTAVGGERAYMAPGDLIITPPWAWHEHGNDGDGPTVWLDVLDVAMIHLFNASFTERRSADASDAALADRNHRHLDGSRMPAVDRVADAVTRGKASLSFSHPYDRTRETLERLTIGGAEDPCHGLRLEYRDPATGGPAMPTISTFMQRLPAGFAGEAYRSTAGTLLCVVEGAGRLTIGDGDAAVEISYRPWDIIAAPSWMPRRFEAESESYVFSASDEAAQRKLGFFREARG